MIFYQGRIKRRGNATIDTREGLETRSRELNFMSLSSLDGSMVGVVYIVVYTQRNSDWATLSYTNKMHY